MQKQRRTLVRRTLAGRTTALVLTLLLTVSLALGLSTFFTTRSWLQTTAIANLEALASGRKVALDAQVGDYLDRIRALSGYHLAHRVQRIAASEGEQRQRRLAELRSRLTRELASTATLKWIGVFDTEARPWLHVGPQKPQKPAVLTNSRTLSAAKVRPVIHDPVFRSGQLELQVAAPIRSPGGATLALLVLDFDAKDLLAITGDYTGLGRTGETVLGARRGSKVRFLTPLRFDPGLSQVEPAPVGGERAKPLLHATAAQSGVTRALDYRDVPVIAAFRPVPATGWGLVVKQDEEEAFSSIAELQTVLLLALGAVLLVGAAVTIPLTFVMTRPLRELQSATERVAAGDLTVEVPEGQRDEVGRLAASFNVMVSRLQAARDRLQHSNEELDAFAYVVSHDLKAPLRGITNLTNWLEEDLEDSLDADQHKQMALIRDRVARMQALIDGLLEFSRIGRVKHSPSAVDCAKLVTEVVESLELGESVAWNIDVRGEIVTDQLRLSQVFQNLIENAVKHHPGPRARIEIKNRERGDRWEFSVADDGDGISPRHHERIFAIFQALPGAEGKQSTGVGLALVKKIVESHGGAIRVESSGEPGEGARFIFTWPKTMREVSDDG